MALFKSLWPFALLLLLILGLYLSNLHTQIHLEWIREKEKILLDYTKRHLLLAPILFVLIYTFSVTLLIPDSTILSILGGFCFPLPLALFYCTLAETLGSLIFFLIFGKALTPLLKRERPLGEKLRLEFGKNKVSYLLFLRISHILPFWVTNLAAAYFKVETKTFIWTTALGVLPLTFLLVNAGGNLGHLFSSQDPIFLSDIFTTGIKLALFGIGLSALLPIFYKKWKAR